MSHGIVCKWTTFPTVAIPAIPFVYSCLHNLFWGSGTHLVIGGTHLATWIIGQVRKTDADEEEIKRCAARIGLDPIVFNAEYRQVPVMTEEQFARIARMLQAFAGELSLKVFQNKQLEEQIMARQKAEEQMSMLALPLKVLVKVSVSPIWMIKSSM